MSEEIKGLKYLIKKQKRKHTTDNERSRVNTFIKKIPFRAYIYVDRDLGKIRHASEWDFLISANGKILFVEAKKDGGILTPSQEIAKHKILKAKTEYTVLDFNDKKYKDGICLYLGLQEYQGLSSVLAILEAYFYC